MTEVTAVNLASRKALLSSGEFLPIVTLFDSDGDETDEPNEARAAIAGSDVFGWWAINLADFEWVSVQ